MHNKIFLQQLKRGKKKTILYVFLLIIAVAFFVTSLNLYQNSITNLEKAEETYSTLAVVEFYGDIDRYGNLVEQNSEDHIGYKAVEASNYDFAPILESSAVTGWDLRTQYAAYIEDTPAMGNFHITRTLGQLIRFKVQGTSPITLDLYAESAAIPLYLDVIDSAADCFKYTDEFYAEPSLLNLEELTGYAEQIKRVNRSDETMKITLYPDVEYVACIWPGTDWTWSEEKGILELWSEDDPRSKSKKNARFVLCYPWVDYENFDVVYDKDKEVLTYTEGFEAGSPFPLQRWEDVQNDPNLKSYYEKAWEDVEIQHYTFNVQLTNDFTSIPAYHVGGASLAEGRLITEEEYLTGSNVCMVSKELASYQNWKIGDKLKMKLFETYYQPEDRLSFCQPVWDSDSNEFIHEAEYEIVGFYSKNPTTGNSGISPNTLDMSMYNIYLPENSVSNRKPVHERILHGSLFSVKLENGSIDQFLNDIEKRGLTVEKEGQYNPKFTFYDQGYSLVQPGLESMNSTATLLLALSTALLIITCVLLAFFFWQNQKQTVGIFRLLGGTKVQALTAVLLCAVILCGIGAGSGAVLGYGMAEAVGNEIMEKNFAESERDAILQAYVLPSDEEQEAVAVRADPLLTIGSCTSVLLFPLTLLAFMAKDINKEPRELLPKSKV